MTTAAVRRPELVRPSAFSPRLTGATMARVLRQLRHDHRTIAMMLLLPSLLLGLLYLLWKDLPTLPGQPSVFDRVGLTMIAIFPFVVMFLVTSIAMLREGELLADSTPARFRAEAGTADLEEAFLRLVRAREEVAA